MNVGLESASDRILRLMRKGYTVDHAEQMMLNMEAAGMRIAHLRHMRFPDRDRSGKREYASLLER